MRFYDVDGTEIDVQDPTFFMDEEVYKEQLEAISEMLSTYD